MGNAALVWAAFVGGWLLFAGPVYQASVELRAQASIRGEIGHVVASVHAPRRISPWWWLLPPVALTLQNMRTRRFQEEAFGVLTPDQIAEWVRLTEKATGWWMVAAGAALIAARETGEIVDLLDAPGWLFWPIAGVAVLACIGFTVVRQHRTEELVGRATAMARGAR